MLRTHFIFARAGIWLAHALLACMLLAVHWHALAAQPLKLSADMPPKMLLEGLEYLEDPAQALSFGQVRALPSDRFTALTLDNLNAGFTASAFWLHATLVNPGGQSIEWTVHHRAPFTDFVEYWVVVDGTVMTTAISGDRTTVGERQVPHRFPAVRHISAPGETAQLFVRVHNNQRAYVPLWFELSSGNQFMRMMAFDQLRFGALYAMPLALAVMALAGWGITRDRRFVLYAFYAVSVLGSWLGVNGQLGEYLFIDMPTVSNNALHIFLLLAVMFLSMFSRDFLRTRELMPWGERYFLMLILLSVIGIVLRLAGVYLQVTLLAIAMLALNAATPAIGWLALRRGVLYARWYVLAQLTYSTTFVLGALIWWLSSGSHGGFILAQYTFFGQLLLLAVAQYDRMRILQRDKERRELDYQERLETQIAQRTRDLEEACAKADQANRSKSEFLANMSDEILTPINTIASCSALALRTQLNATQSGYLERIRVATQGLSRIIYGLLNFSKIETGQLKLEHIPFDLQQVIEIVMSCVGAQAGKKGLRLSIHADADVPARWIGDPLQLEQVLLNLCSNAVKFTEQGEVEVRVSLQSRTADSARLLFVVRDTGIGLSPEQAGRLFTQADTSATRKFGDTGLGLVISQQLVGMMNGSIWLQSTEGEGTTFFFDVELASAPEEDTQVPAIPPVQPPQACHGKLLAGMRILLVDNNPINQKLARELLEQEGARVRIAANGRLAVDAVRELGAGSFDAALLDLQMPEMDGYEVTRQIRQLPGGADLALIAMIAHAMLEEHKRCLDAGMNDHIVKPIESEVLVKTLMYWIGIHRLTRLAAFDAEADSCAGDAAAHAPERDAVAVPGQPAAELEQLLERFAETLATVNAGLAPLVSEQVPPADEDGGANDPDLLLRLQPLLQELRGCLQHNDTCAEQWVTEMEKLTAGQPPLWLTRLADAVRALEYDAALELLPQG